MAEDTWLRRAAHPKVTRWVYSAGALMCLALAVVDGQGAMWVGVVVFAVSAVTRHVLYRLFLRTPPDA